MNLTSLNRNDLLAKDEEVREDLIVEKKIIFHNFVALQSTFVVRRWRLK